MPTGAKLVAATCLAILGLVLAVMITPLVPELSDFPYLVPVNMAVGALVGWISMAPRAGGGVGRAVANGLTGAAVLAFWGLAAIGVIRMIDLSMKQQYRGFGDAVVAIFSISAEYFLLFATVPVGIALVVGGVLSSLVVNYADRKWP
ncbi:TrgA family protein [Sulfitobacter sp.]|jgi:hypothetical protein|uniref:TrgA family protein n=1 Tax=Sulfitobacter sp. TaxID=1903071 RepID=UPI0039E674B2